MAQPMPPKTRQSAPPAKPASKDALHQLTPGGPILPHMQPPGKPNPTDRGDEPNTQMHKGEVNPAQRGSDVRHGDHEPGMGQAGDPHGHGIHAPTATGRTGEHSSKLAPPMPDPKGVRK